MNTNQHNLSISVASAYAKLQQSIHEERIAISQELRRLLAENRERAINDVDWLQATALRRAQQRVQRSQQRTFQIEAARTEATFSAESSTYTSF